MATNSATNNFEINVEQGTAPYKVYVNGIQKLETNDTTISLDAKQGDLIELKTSVACEGTVSQKIASLNNAVTAYPNPAKDFVNITIPTAEKEVEIEIYSADGKLVSKQFYTIVSGEAKVDLSKLQDGVYFAKVSSKNPANIKIIKKH